MSVNSPSSSNASFSPFQFSFSINTYFILHNCVTSMAGINSVTAFTITSIVALLPVCIVILHLGLQRWRQQRSNTRMSHSDIFTYHMVAKELISMLGSILTCFGSHTGLIRMTMVGVYFCINNLFGQMYFHLLTCVERYLAVVHPITYRNLGKEKGIRIRNITIGCVWLWCFAGTGFIFMEDHYLTIILFFCVIALSLIVISFCSISVLCVLIRPGPGEAGRARHRIDQSKLRAFYTIMIVLGVLLLRLGGYILVTTVSTSAHVREMDKCLVLLSVLWFSLPSSLVLLLLFLHRAGKLPCCKNNNQSGQGSD